MLSDLQGVQNSPYFNHAGAQKKAENQLQAQSAFERATH